MSLDGIFLEVIAVTLQLFGFLDWFLTSAVAVGVLGVVLFVVGAVFILRRRILERGTE